MPVGQMPVGQMPVSQIPVSQIPVGQMPVSRMSVGQMSVGWMLFVQMTWNPNFFFPTFQSYFKSGKVDWLVTFKDKLKRKLFGLSSLYTGDLADQLSTAFSKNAVHNVAVKPDKLIEYSQGSFGNGLFTYQVWLLHYAMHFLNYAS